MAVIATIPVGTEPRGCALTPNGSLLYVANHTEGTVSIVDASERKVVEDRGRWRESDGHRHHQ